MFDIVCVAHIPGPVGLPVLFGHHRFYRMDDGALGHDIDGRHMAAVPPEGMGEYARAWPQCAELVAQLTRATPAADETVPGREL